MKISISLPLILCISFCLAHSLESFAAKKSKSKPKKSFFQKSKERDEEKGTGEIILDGEQRQGYVKIDLTKNNVRVAKLYTVPRGKTLHFTGAGTIKYTITGNAYHKASAPHPIYGGGGPAGWHNTWSSIKVFGKLIMGEKKPIEETDHSQLPSINLGRTYFGTGAWIEAYNLAYKANGHTSHCNIKIYNCLLNSSSLALNPKYKSYIYHSILDTRIHFTKNDPRMIRNNIKIENCVIYDELRASMSSLWSMDKCDIYGRPFVIKNYKWASVANIPGKNYFHDTEFPLYLEHAFQEDINKGIKVKVATQPYNDFTKMRGVY